MQLTVSSIHIVCTCTSNRLLSTCVHVSGQQFKATVPIETLWDRNQIRYSYLNSIMADVQLIPVSFPNVDPADSMFSNVGLVLCNVPCSLSSVLHPIDYIMQEGG